MGAVDELGQVGEEELQELVKEAGEQLFKETVVFHAPILEAFSERRLTQFVRTMTFNILEAPCPFSTLTCIGSLSASS